MLDQDIKLNWGRTPQLKFNNYEEIFEALGQISNSKYCSIHYEFNSLNGSYTDVFRVKFKISPKLLLEPIQKKITSQWRFNCHEFIQFFIDKNVFKYSERTRKFDRNYDTIVAWIFNQNPEYIEYFNKGYFETENNTLMSEPKIEPKDLFFINDDFLDKIKLRKLTKRSIPTVSQTENTTTSSSKKNIRRTDYIRKNIRDSELGLLGELYVYKFEYNKLKQAEYQGIIESVEDVLTWISKIDDSAGYDIKSYDLETKESIFIEIKTTSNSADTPFYISENEIAFSKSKSDNYKLYRLYNFKKDDSEDIEFFEIIGDISNNKNLILTPKTYEVRIKS